MYRQLKKGIEKFTTYEKNHINIKHREINTRLYRKSKLNATHFDVPEDIPYDSLNLFAIIVGNGAKR